MHPLAAGRHTQSLTDGLLPPLAALTTHSSSPQKHSADLRSIYRRSMPECELRRLLVEIVMFLSLECRISTCATPPQAWRRAYRWTCMRDIARPTPLGCGPHYYQFRHTGPVKPPSRLRPIVVTFGIARTPSLSPARPAVFTIILQPFTDS